MKKFKKIIVAGRSMYGFFTLLIRTFFQKTLAISAPYFDEEKLKDGYFRRIKAIDDLLENNYSLYLSPCEDCVYPQVKKHGRYTTVYYYNESKPTHKISLIPLMFAAGKVYCHSIYRVRPFYFNIPFLKVYLDVHGIVPEEESLRGNCEISELMNKIESIAINKCTHLFTVTEAMANFLINKYGDIVSGKYTVLPICDRNILSCANKEKKLPDGRYTVVYAGGCAKWQKTKLMQDVIFKTAQNFDFKICVPNPEEFMKTWKYESIPDTLDVKSKTYRQLCEEIYPQAQYGFVLRDDIAVNKVACPTKIIEYLAHNIIPIVKSPDIGDFKNMGMVYITLEDFLAGRLLTPDEYCAAISQNQNLVKKYIEIYVNSCEKFRKILKCN